MKQDTIEKIVSLCLIIGFLGERRQFNWWSSSFINTNSGTFLTPMYPRTLLTAKYQGVREAATKIHDEHIGVGKTYHLFRLPEFIEQAARQALLKSAFADQIQPSLATIEAALAALAGFVKVEQVVGEGPVWSGNIEDIEQPELISNMAAVYYFAFQNDIKSYPYLRGKEMHVSSSFRLLIAVKYNATGLTQPSVG
jgi:hypothetical protein